jgi:signal recognition particle subunit SRP54
MLDGLTQGFRNARLKLKGKAQLSEANIAEALRDVRISLLEGDVDLDVVKDFLEAVKVRSVGEVVPLRVKKGETNPISAGDHFVKICHDELVRIMGGDPVELDMEQEPSVIMMVGLQGSGKTTTAGKLASKLKKEGKKPLLVAADIYRPAAIDQLQVLGRQLGLPVFSIKGMDPVTLSRLAVRQAKSVGRDVVIIDTAGRLAIDNTLMDEVLKIKAEVRPRNILFVCDAMIGQDAVQTAAKFDKVLDFSGFVLTKMDGDARGGAALSIHQVTGKPVLFLGMGEGLEDLERFRPEGLASRILGMGDVVGLVEDFQEHVTEEEAAASATKMLSGDFTFNDFLSQLETIQQMGSLTDLMDKMPGFSDMKSQLPEGALDESELTRVKSAIFSMTKQERENPDLLTSHSRIDRIARGSGQTANAVRSIYTRFLGARKMMRQMGQASGMFGSLRQMRKMRKQMKRMGMGDMAGMGEMLAGAPEVEEPRLSPDEVMEKRKAARAARRKRRGKRR